MTDCKLAANLHLCSDRQGLLRAGAGQHGADPGEPEQEDLVRLRPIWQGAGAEVGDQLSPARSAALANTGQVRQMAHRISERLNEEKTERRRQKVRSMIFLSINKQLTFT